MTTNRQPINGHRHAKSYLSNFNELSLTYLSNYSNANAIDDGERTVLYSNVWLLPSSLAWKAVGSVGWLCLTAS